MNQFISNKDLEGVQTQGSIYDIACRTAVGPHKNDNEDCVGFRIIQDSLIAAVSDGVGSCPLAGEASTRVISEIVNIDQDSELDLLTLLDNCNQKVLDLKVGSACTLAMVYLQSRTLRYLCVGDSSIKVFGGRGRLKLDSIGQSSLDLGQAAGLVGEPPERKHQSLGNELVNYLGAAICRYEVSNQLTLAPQDTILVGSDGVFDNIKNDDLVQFLQSATDSKDLCENIMSWLGREMIENNSLKQDDASLMVIKLVS